MSAKTIGLILNDSELFQNMRDEILRKSGFHTIDLDDEQARTTLRERKDLDLVIIGVSGLERENFNRVSTYLETNPQTPMVVIFEGGSFSNQVDVFRLGAADSLTLPLKGEELLEVIDRSIYRWSRLKNVSPTSKITEPGSPVENSPGGISLSLRDLEAILNSATDGIIILDGMNRLSFINSSARQIFDINQEDWAGILLTSLIDHADLSGMVSNLAEARMQHDEISLKNGKVYNTQLSSIPGKGTLIIMQDISHLKDMDRIKSDFVATVSHDLRSPLTAILGYTELIDRVGPINDQQREFIRRIQFSTHNITNLINDLLDLRRIEAGFDSQKEMVSLTSIARYAVEGLRSRMEEKKQDIQLELQEDLPSIFGNPIRLRQMAGNLIGNAVKYTPPGGHIWVRVMAGEGIQIFQVQDTGPGIYPQEQAHIFNKFYRGTNFPSETPGTGLGLAIVKSIAENHQGRVWVDSIPEKGSTFTVVLPVVEPA